VKWLKRIGCPDLPALLQWLIHEWFQRAEPIVATKDAEVTYAEFTAAWHLWDRSDNHNLRAALAAVGPDLRLITLCQALQQFSAPEPFYLSVRFAASLLGVSKSTAHRALLGLEETGVITRVQTGDYTTRLAITCKMQTCQERNGD
jgi:hypothetical protein